MGRGGGVKIGRLYKTLAPSEDWRRLTTIAWSSEDLNGEEGSVVEVPVGSLCIVLESGVVEDDLSGKLVEWSKCMLPNGTKVWIHGGELQEVT